MHVGATPLQPLFAHPSDAAPMSTYPSLHVNVAVEPCVFPLLKTGALPFTGALSDEHNAVGAALGIEVGTDVGVAVGNAVGMDVPHVGTASVDQPTEPTPATVHVRVVAALIANPAKQ